MRREELEKDGFESSTLQRNERIERCELHGEGYRLEQ
jgi:hypothetical protein